MKVCASATHSCASASPPETGSSSTSKNAATPYCRWSPSPETSFTPSSIALSAPTAASTGSSGYGVELSFEATW